MPETFRMCAGRALLCCWPFARGRTRLTRLVLGADAGVLRGIEVRSRTGLVFRLRGDPMEWPLYTTGLYEAALTRIYRRLIRPGDTVLDVGANIGWYAVHFAAWTGETGHVHAFEPLPETCERAEDTVRLNGMESIISLNNVGLGCESGSFTLYLFPGRSDGHATATSLQRSDAVPHTCRIITLDEYIAKNGLTKVDFMKCDVEGHERDVFLGGSDLLSREDAPIVGFEIQLKCLQDRGLTPNDVVNSLKCLGYTDFCYRKAGNLTRLAPGLLKKSGDYIACKPLRRERLHDLI